jgi:hypothetical protein
MNIDERIENITTAMEAMKGSLEAMKERHDALTMNLELISHQIHDLKIASQQDGENIRAQARIAEIHNRRITDLEN